MNKRLALLGILAILITGCEKQPPIQNTAESSMTPPKTHNGKKIDVAEWQEEVLLYDGRTVIVSRKAVAYSGGFPNASRGRDISEELSVVGTSVSWRHEASETSLRSPTSIEIIDGVAYLALYVLDRPEIFCDGKQATQYLAQFLRWHEGRWIEIPQNEFPSEKSLVNLYEGFWGHTAKDDAKGLIPWKGKRVAGSQGDTVKSYFENYHRTCALHQK